MTLYQPLNRYRFMNPIYQKILDLGFIAAGFIFRHFLFTNDNKRLTNEILKLQSNKEDLAEIKSNLAETRYFMAVHENSCPYIKQKIAEEKETAKLIFGGGAK